MRFLENKSSFKMFFMCSALVIVSAAGLCGCVAQEASSDNADGVNSDNTTTNQTKISVEEQKKQNEEALAQGWYNQTSIELPSFEDGTREWEVELDLPIALISSGAESRSEKIDSPTGMSDIFILSGRSQGDATLKFTLSDDVSADLGYTTIEYPISVNEKMMIQVGEPSYS